MWKRYGKPWKPRVETVIFSVYNQLLTEGVADRGGRREALNIMALIWKPPLDCLTKIQWLTGRFGNATDPERSVKVITAPLGRFCGFNARDVRKIGDMDVKEESRRVFVADDGSVFATEKEALERDDQIRKRERAFRQLKVYRVSHGFEANEGRGYFAKTLVITDAPSPVVIQWCIDTFGPPLSPWYGDGHYEEWVLSMPNGSDTVEWALAHDGFKDGKYHRPWQLVTISRQDFSWAGLPVSLYPWPRPKPSPASV